MGLDLYKQIDEGFYELEKKQYEYELTGQGETGVQEVVWPILEGEWLRCKIDSADDIEKMLGNTDPSKTTAFIIERCGSEDAPTPTLLVEKVQNSLGQVKNNFSDRAREKSQKTYEIARIGLYSDGNIENSPFDLMRDLEEIDRIIFSEELQYEWVEQEKSMDEMLEDFLEEDKDYLYEEENEDDENTDEDDENTDEDEDTLITPPILEDTFEDHDYICRPGDDTSGLDEDELQDILDGIEWTNGSGRVILPRTWVYPGPWPSNGASWGWPFPGVWPDWDYAEVRDSWPCDPSQVFCIIIEFQRSTYGLAGGETVAIDKILEKAAKHLEKPANASLTQKKMTTNNFEISSIIKNLPDMLRGLGAEVQTKPVPILDLESENEDTMKGDLTEIENLICVIYKNNGFDCERQNDLGEFKNAEEEQKIFQSAAHMPITYPQIRMNELSSFQNALEENNRIISASLSQQVLYDDMKQFGDQFTELERFVLAMQDFVEWLKGEVSEMKKIPTRSN